MQYTKLVVIYLAQTLNYALFKIPTRILRSYYIQNHLQISQSTLLNILPKLQWVLKTEMSWEIARNRCRLVATAKTFVSHLHLVISARTSCLNTELVRDISFFHLEHGLL